MEQEQKKKQEPFRTWTPEEIKKLKENYYTHSTQELAKMFNTTVRRVGDKISKLRRAGKFPERKPTMRQTGFDHWAAIWSPAMVETLHREYPNTDSKVLAKKLNISLDSLNKKANKLKIKKTPEFIRESYATRQTGRPKGKKSTNKTRKDSKGHHWTAEQIETLKRIYPAMSNVKVAETLKISLTSIRSKALTLQLQKVQKTLMRPKLARPEKKVKADRSAFRPAPSRTFAQAIENRRPLEVQVNGKPITIWVNPGQEKAAKAKYAAHQVCPPSSFTRAGGQRI